MFKDLRNATLLIGIGGFILLFLQTFYFALTNINGAQSYNGDPTGMKILYFIVLTVAPGCAAGVVYYLGRKREVLHENRFVLAALIGLNITMGFGVVMALGNIV